MSDVGNLWEAYNRVKVISILVFKKYCSVHIQRVVRFGHPQNFSFFNNRKQLLEAHSKKIKNKEVLERLSIMAEEQALYSFSSPEEASHLLSNERIYQILRSPGFKEKYSTSPIEKRLLAWADSELEEMSLTLDDEAVCNELSEYRQKINPLMESDVKQVIPFVLEIDQLLTKRYQQMFQLDVNRNMPFSDGGGDESKKYGFHLTKFHNLPGIMLNGLSPKEGATDRGSLAMSTAEQKKGSEQTSKNVIAFGLKPSTFRPYINQFEDRRQMIEETPNEMKPVMLRFPIADAIPKKSIGYDYMDQTARNTTSPILPKFIEVLMPGGWIRLTDYRVEMDHIEHRSSNDNARAAVKWTGQKVVMTLDEINKVSKDNPIKKYYDTNKDNDLGMVQWLEKQRDTELFRDKNNKYNFVFRGATMQTSGNAHSWEYAFTVNGPTPFPQWLQEYVRAYSTNYGERATNQIESGKKDYATFLNKDQPESKTINKAKLDENLREGNASGDGLNCLLSSIYQLRNRTEIENQQEINQMRETLHQAGLVPAVGMIDIYGGAGMQLANDLNVQIQVIQNVNGNYVVHPTLGDRGRRLYILHEGNHFSPLWPIQNKAASSTSSSNSDSK